MKKEEGMDGGFIWGFGIWRRNVLVMVMVMIGSGLERMHDRECEDGL